MSETPILDLEQEPPALRKSWRSRVIGAVIGVCIGLSLVLKDQGLLPDWRLPPFNGLLLLPALYVAIAFHELGHLFAGRLAGFKTGGISVGPFVLVQSGSNWSFQVVWSRWMGGFYKPLANKKAMPTARYGWMVAGGPLGNVFLAACCFAFRALAGDGVWNITSSLFWISLFMAITSLIPYSVGLNRTDGATLFVFLRHPERARSWVALIALQTEDANGVRPRDWDPDLVEEALLAIDAGSPEYPYRKLMASYRRLDEGHEPAALRDFERALSQSNRGGKAFQHLLFLEAAYTSAAVLRRAEQARIWRDRALKLRKPESLAAVGAAIAMCEGRYADAIQQWEANTSFVVRRKLDSGLIRFGREKWAALEAECRTQMTASDQAALTMSRNE